MEKHFATTNQNPSLYQNSTVVNSTGTSGLANEFNTMQNLFATGTNLGGMTNLGQSYQPIANIQASSNGSFTTGSNLNDLYPSSGINLTQLQSNPIPQQSQSIGQLDKFNTMQNLFATGNAGLGAQNLASSVQSVANLQNINLQEFNTMQNLFKTGGTPILPPPQVANSEPHDPFSVLSMPQTTQATQKVDIKATTTNSNNMGMFNTYSGNKNSGAVLDVSSFGTMQKGQIGAIDFLQNLPTQPQQTQQEVPNFSKKKQPIEDLI